MIGFLMFIFHLKKIPRKYVLTLNSWLCKMHCYFRVACVNGDFMICAAACYLECSFSFSICQRVACDGGLVCCFSDRLGFDLQKQITSETVISMVKAEVLNTQKIRFQVLWMLKDQWMFFCFLCLRASSKVSLFLTSPGTLPSAVRNIAKTARQKYCCSGVTGWVAIKVSEMLKSRQ